MVYFVQICTNIHVYIFGVFKKKIILYIYFFGQGLCQLQKQATVEPSLQTGRDPVIIISLA